MMVLSHFQAQRLLDAIRGGRASVRVSLDLNRTETVVPLADGGVVLPDGQRIGADILTDIADTETVCFHIANETAHKIQFYSAAFQRFYSLFPTDRAPTMLLAGFPMHRIKGIDPEEDTRRKLRTLAPIQGAVLDICTGLGYTAVAAARSAASVLTIELDSTVLEVCRLNPWSQGLFHSPHIEQRIGNAADIVETLPDNAYTRLFHDPPAFKLAGELYSGAMYRELFRVLRRGGRLFHYIGDLDSTSGRVVVKGVVKRLQEAGFTGITRHAEAFGVSAQK
jgi:predicted methyltransferase